MDISHVKDGSAFKPPVTIYLSTQCHIPEDLNLQQCHCENLKLHLILFDDALPAITVLK
jgi:hypothetical protein